MSGMNCTVEDIVRLCRQCERSELKWAVAMKDERNKHFCLGMASAYKHVREQIESEIHCKRNPSHHDGEASAPCVDGIVRQKELNQ